jgi:hypothetical protein
MVVIREDKEGMKSGANHDTEVTVDEPSDYGTPLVHLE